MSCPGHPSTIRPAAPHRDCTTCAQYQWGSDGPVPVWVGGKCPVRVPTEAKG